MKKTIKTEAELKAELVVKRQALDTFRFGMAHSKVKNVREGRMLRKDIARVLTSLNQKA